MANLDNPVVENQGVQSNRIVKDIESIEPQDVRAKEFRESIIARYKGKNIRLRTFLKEKQDYFRGLDIDARNRRLRDIGMMFHYYDGDQYGDYDARGQWLPGGVQDWDTAYTIPIIKGYVDQAVSQWLKVKPDYKFESYDDTEKQLELMCEVLALEDKDNLITDDIRPLEALTACLAGSAFRDVFWGLDPENPRTAKRIKYRKEQIAVPGRRYCEACKSDVAEGEQACPKCAATFITDVPPGKATKYIGEEEEIPLPENRLHSPHAMSVQRSLSARTLHNSSFIIERDYLEKHKAEWEYQTVLGNDDVNLSTEMQYRHDMERSTIQTDAMPNSTRNGTGVQGEPVEREYHFWDPSEYGYFYLDQDETLPDGTILPEGTILGEAYTMGLHVLFLGTTVQSFESTKKNRRWSEIVYGVRPGTAGGQGFHLLIPLQDIENDSFNLEYSILMTHGKPLTAMIRQSVPEMPDERGFIFIDKVPDGGIPNAIHQWPGQGASGMLGVTSERIQGAMQFISGTQTISGYGAADQQAAMRTATAVVAAKEMGADRQGSPVLMMIAADKVLMYQCLENRRDFSVPEQWKALEKRFGPDTVKAFKKCNFRKAMKITIANNTDMPRSMAVSFATMSAYIEAVVNLAQVPNAAEYLAMYGDVLGIPKQVGMGREDRREAEYRINKLLAIEETIQKKNPDLLNQPDKASAIMLDELAKFEQWALVEGEPEPPELDPVTRQPLPPQLGMNGQPVIPEPPQPLINPFLHDHEAMMDVYKGWLLGEKAKCASDAMKFAVIEMYMQHMKSAMYKEGKAAQMQAEIQATLAPPMPPPEQQPDPAALKQAADEQHAQATDDEGAKRMADEVSKDRQSERDLEMKVADATIEVEKAKGLKKLEPKEEKGK